VLRPAPGGRVQTLRIPVRLSEAEG
jgi:hypothetical protein